jgi:hypothetical protein
VQPYIPLLLAGEDGVVHGNDWANGFMRGSQFYAEAETLDGYGDCPSS